MSDSCIHCDGSKCNVYSIRQVKEYYYAEDQMCRYHMGAWDLAKLSCVLYEGYW
jgi:hypothetical protein